MIVKKFYGTNTRDALRQVRDALGPDALILANRQIAGGGVEIMAVSDNDVATLTSPTSTGDRTMRPQAGAARPPVVPVPPEPQQNQRIARTYTMPEDDAEESSDAFISALSTNDPGLPPAPARETRQAEPIRPIVSPQPEARAVPNYMVDPVPVPRARPRPESQPANPAAAKGADPAAEGIADIVKELKFLRGMMEGQLAGFAWSDLQDKAPEKLEMFRRLLSYGFSPQLIRQLLDHLPPNYDIPTGMKWVRTALARNLPCVPAGQDLIDKGGVYALVGPTGVGKTTTVAKLAARCTLKHGPSKVALLTTDSYRIGAHDQLRIYGKILGVPVYSVKDEADLQLTLADLSSRYMILIDTVGMSQRDKRLTEQVAMLTGHGENIQRLLLLSATGQGSTLDDVVRCYHTPALSGCILTKLDEAVNLGASLDVIIRHKLTLHYVTNGQRVPEDLHQPNPLYLLDRACRAEPADSAYALRAEEYPLYYGSSTSDTGAPHG